MDLAPSRHISRVALDHARKLVLTLAAMKQLTNKMNHTNLKPSPETLPQVLKYGPYKWNVITCIGKDILGNFHFTIASTHKSRASALKAKAALINKNK